MLGYPNSIIGLRRKPIIINDGSTDDVSVHTDDENYYILFNINKYAA